MTRIERCRRAVERKALPPQAGSWLEIIHMMIFGPIRSSLAVVGLLTLTTTLAAGPSGAGVVTGYACVTKSGERKVEGRPIKACSDVPQKMLSSNGVQIGTLEPVKTIREQQDEEERVREANARADARAVQLRSDKSLLKKYPNEAALQKAREAEIDNVEQAIQRLQTSLGPLKSDRARLERDEGFFQGAFASKMPVALRTSLDDNQARQDGIHSVIDGRRADVVAIHNKFNELQSRLRHLRASR